MTIRTLTLRVRRLAAMTPGREILADAALVLTLPSGLSRPDGGETAEAQACRPHAPPDLPVLPSDARIVELGPWPDIKTKATGPVLDLGELTLLPGLVNAHGHLELAHLGLPPFRGLGFLEWVRWLVAQPLDALTPQALEAAVAQMRACGAAGAADITSRKAAMVSAALSACGIEHLMQHERFGWGQDSPLPDIPEERLSLAGHALYSTSPEALRRAKDWDRARGKVFSIHLAEHEGETELLASGGGPFADFLRQRVLPEDYPPPGISPVAQAQALGLLDARTLCVHAVHVSRQDLDLLKASGAAVCLCPRSNEIIGSGGRAPARSYLDAGLPVCLGTDSLASAPDLDLFAELRALLAFTGVSLTQAVAMLATTPARLFGFAELGRLAPGLPARLARLPEDLEDALGD